MVLFELKHMYVCQMRMKLSTGERGMEPKKKLVDVDTSHMQRVQPAHAKICCCVFDWSKC